MTARRSLDQALSKLNLSKTAIAFVNEGTPKLRETTEVSGDSNTAFDSLLPRGTPGDSVSVGEVPSHLSHAAMGQHVVPGSVSVTFRLPSELSVRLLRVSLDRKLKRQKPFTQQDILAEALAVWFTNQSCPD